jgi:aspartate carbamoyltransferase regulatory subunit
MINVSKLKKGIVIDHIKPGQGYKLFSQLELDKLDDVVVLLRNVPSKKMGKKDLIKIETDLELDFDILGLVDPGATVNYVEDGIRVKKIQVALPHEVYGILKCKNPRCITQTEHTDKIKFILFDEEKKIFRCEYCDSLTSL